MGMKYEFKEKGRDANFSTAEEELLLLVVFFFFFLIFIYLFIYFLFIYGCVGSSFLCEGFL